MEIPTFKTKKELFDFLVKNRDEISDIKKSELHKADYFGYTNFESSLFKRVNKSFNAAEKSLDQDTEEFVYRTIIGNTYLWLDSHKDVHIPGIFTKSTKDNQAKIRHQHDHIQELNAKVGIFSKVYEKEVLWTDLGVNIAGYTTCLLADTKIVKQLNPSIFYQYKENQIDQHSVGMIYVNLFLCINDPDYKEEFANWNKYSTLVGNQDKLIASGYFWAITEAKLIEISCVTAGSNELTGIMEDKQEPTIKVTLDNEESPQSTQVEKVTKIFYSNYI